MTGIDLTWLTAYEVKPDPWWEKARDEGDGYDRTEFMEPFGWLALNSWGEDGWDLWAWPHQMVYVRREAHGVGVATNVEGDVTQYHADAKDEAWKIIDCLFVWYWQFHEADRRRNGLDELVDVVTWETIPERFRGPYGATRRATPSQTGANL